MEKGRGVGPLDSGTSATVESWLWWDTFLPEGLICGDCGRR